MNFALAISAFSISLAALPSRPTTTAPPGLVIGKPLYGLPRESVLLILFTTGLVSMGLEVVWIRQFTPYMGNVVYTFAGILMAYLLATFWGSQDYRSWARFHSLEESAPSWTLLALFSLIPLATSDPLLPLRIGPLELGGCACQVSCSFALWLGFSLRCS